MKFHAFGALVATLATFLPAHAAQPSAGLARVADVRELPKAAHLVQWEGVDGGYVTHLQAQSAAALGLRVRLELGAVPGAMQIRVRGSDPGRVETMVLDPALGPEAWTPWTEGESQSIEIFSPVAPAEGAVRVGAVLHFTASPFAKAAASCTLSTKCTSGDPALDAAIEERKKSVARIQFVKDGGGFVCTSTLIDTPRNPAAYALTANHCIPTQAVASSISSFWFYEATACGAAGGVNPAFVQTAGGAQLVFTNYDVDSTVLLMNRAPPAGVTYAPLHPAQLTQDAPVVSISHPDGDTSRWADGTLQGVARVLDLPYDNYVAQFTRGLIQGGSSGSGLYTRANGRLELAGVLSLGPLDESCESTNKFGIYSRMEVTYPQIAKYIGVSAPGADDAPNQVSEATVAVTAVPIDTLPQPAVTLSRRIDYAGDIDVFRFTVASAAAVSVYTQGSQDTVGTLFDANGIEIESNDDVQTVDNNTGITRVLQPGTYFYHVAHWLPSGTGAYDVVFRADRVDTNYTALWWNPAESGWGINLDHQGNIIFATLFTYDETGAPMWLVMSRGERQADGSYAGLLHRTTGPPFNTVPWRAVGAVEVGAMRLVFSGANDATLTYTYNGRAVTKSITRQLFKKAPTCSWSIFDRSFEQNVQDLLWNPQESGWGVNIAHQEKTLFATLFTYDANGQGLWLVMPEGVPDSAGVFHGALYRTRGPAFDAQPWSAVTPTAVGTMSFTFADGNSATLAYTVDGVTVNKVIQRQVFSSPKTRCES